MARTEVDYMDALKERFAAEFSESKTKTRDMFKFIMDGICDILVENVKNPDFRVTTKFGTFKAHATKAKVGRNPRTGEKVSISAKHKVTFKASKCVADAGR